MWTIRTCGCLALALLSSLAVGVAQDCALSEDSADEPDGVAELQSRFAANFAEYSNGEVAEARTLRNEMRAVAPRILADPDLFGPGLELSTRFCGLSYGNSTRARAVACQPDSVDELGSQRFLSACYDATPIDCAESCCSVDDLGPGARDLPKYFVSVGPTLATPVVAAVGYEALCLLWYLLRRCCGMCGGRTPSSKCQCPCFGKHFAGYGTIHVRIFRALAVLCLCSTLTAAIIALVGNARVTSGLGSATEILLHELGELANRFDVTLVRIAKGGGGPTAAPSASMLAVAADFRCKVAGMQAELESTGGSALLGRAILAPTVAVLPMLVAGASVMAAMNNEPKLIRAMAVVLYPVVFFVFLSSGVHMLIAVVLGDLCTELDLLLHTPRGETVSVPFLPDDPPLIPCGGGSSDSFGSLENELLRQMQPALDFVGHQLLQACNSEDEFEGFRLSSLNCTGIAGPSGLLQGVTGPDRRGPPYTAGRYSAENIERALVEVTLGDPGIAVGEDGRDEQGGFCDVTAEGQRIAVTAGMVCGLEEAAVTTCQPPAAWLTAASRRQSLETRRTLLDCGSIGARGCKLPLLQSLACRIASEKNAMLMRARELSQLNKLSIEPMARCEFAHDIFAPVFMAVCVDTVNALSLLGIATTLCGGTLLFMMPYAVMAVKRFDEQNQRGVVGKISPDGGNHFAAASVDNNLLDFSASGGALAVRPPEGDRTLLVNGPVMKCGRHFCEFVLTKTKLGDHIVGIARPNFKPAGSGGGASASASVKKGKGLGWGIRTYSGALCHAGRSQSWEGQTKMPQGSCVGLLLDLHEGSLTCYLNGRKLGAVIPAREDGSTCGVEGPLVWMCELMSEGDAVRVQKVPAPVGLPERFTHEP